MFERFTEHARHVMELANREAQRFGHARIGTEHILWGLAKENHGVAAAVLEHFNVDLKPLRQEVESLLQDRAHLEDVAKLPRVDIIYAHANMDDKLINAALQDGAQGIVIAGVGDGNMSKPALDAVTAAAKKGIVVVRSTRVGTGVVLRNAEVNDNETGTVASGEFNPGKSRVLAQLALTTKKHSSNDVQRMFNQY